MKLRSSIAAVLVCTTLSVGRPVAVHAQEPERTTPTVYLGPTPRTLEIQPRLGLGMASSGLAGRVSMFAPTPNEIRLSSGAKTAIIVGAIVVGVLVIVGVVVLARPGKHL